MNTQTAVRMCPECMTTDANFPNIDGCRSCTAMLAQEEAVFWTTPLYLEPLYSRKGEPLGDLAVFPEDVIKSIRVPWHIALVRMLMLE